MIMITEPDPGVYSVTPDVETESILQSLADYHQITKSEALSELIIHGRKRYVQRTLAQIEGPPKNKP